MKELQKYSVVTLYKLGNINLEYPVVYLASEADDAFAEMRRAHVQALIEQRDTDSGRLHKIFDAEIERLKQHHAEEIERLKAERDLMEKHWQISSDSLERATRSLLELRKQAERYEKLRSRTVLEFSRLKDARADQFDELVDLI